MPKKKTDKEYRDDFYRIVKDEFELLSTYIGADKPIEVKHNVCGCIRTVRADKLYTKHGIGCLNCTNKGQTKTTDTFKKELLEATGGEFTLEEPYINNKTKVTFKHTVCGKTFKAYPKNVVNNKNCYYCRPIGVTKSPEKFREDISDRLEEYSLLTEYENSRKKIKVLHKSCGNVWELYPVRFMLGAKCPYCNHSSKGEDIVREILKEKEIDFIEQKTFSDLKYKARLRFDFFIPSSNIAIEYQGIQHYRPYSFGSNSLTEYNEQVVRDEIKRKFSKESGIKLIEIPYYTDTYKEVKEEIEKYL